MFILKQATASSASPLWTCLNCWGKDPTGAACSCQTAWRWCRSPRWRRWEKLKGWWSYKGTKRRLCSLIAHTGYPKDWLESWWVFNVVFSVINCTNYLLFPRPDSTAKSPIWFAAARPPCTLTWWPARGGRGERGRGTSGNCWRELMETHRRSWRRWCWNWWRRCRLGFSLCLIQSKTAMHFPSDSHNVLVSRYSFQIFPPGYSAGISGLPLLWSTAGKRFLAGEICWSEIHCQAKGGRRRRSSRHQTETFRAGDEVMAILHSISSFRFLSVSLLSRPFSREDSGSILGCAMASVLPSKYFKIPERTVVEFSTILNKTVVLVRSFSVKNTFIHFFHQSNSFLPRTPRPSLAAARWAAAWASPAGGSTTQLPLG